MTKEQLKFLESKLNKDNGKGRTLALSTQYDLDNNVTFRNNNDFVIFDDDHELIYCIAANRQSNVKDEAPYTVITSPYEFLQYTEHNLDLDGLKEALDDLFAPMLKGDQKKIILNWAENLPVHPKNPNVGMDYYKKKAPHIPQKPITSEILKSEAAAPELDHSASYIKKITKSVNSFIAGIPAKNAAYSSVSLVNNNVSIVINSSDNLELGLTEFLSGLEGLDSVEFKTEKGETVTMTIEDKDSYNTFKEGVIKFMPTNQNETASGTFTGAVGEKTVVYTLNVKYYNKEQDKVRVNGKSYPTVQAALTDIGAGTATIALNSDISESITIPEGADITLDLAGKEFSNNGEATIRNKGKLTITGAGVIDNTTHGKACLTNEMGGEVTILGGIFTRSQESGKTNSFYAIQNMGTMVIGAEGAENNIGVALEGDYSSMICNEIDTDKYTVPEGTHCKLTIYGGNFEGGLNTIKNGEHGILDIKGGTFSNSVQCAVLNWNDCTINGGTFECENLPCATNGKYNNVAQGKLVINDGEFTSGTAACLDTVESYPSTDISVYGGTYSSDPATYVASGYKSVKGGDGKYTIQEATPEEKIDDVIEGLTGIEVEKDSSAENTFNITTDDGAISDSGLFDKVAAVKGVKTIVVSNGTDSVTYTEGGDLEAFKTSIDGLCPKDTTSGTVTLTMTVTIQ